MNLSFLWLRKAWPVYRNYVKQRRWHKAREHMVGFMAPVCEYLSLTEMLAASGAISH